MWTKLSHFFREMRQRFAHSAYAVSFWTVLDSCGQKLSQIFREMRQHG